MYIAENRLLFDLLYLRELHMCFGRVFQSLSLSGYHFTSYRLA